MGDFVGDSEENPELDHEACGGGRDKIGGAETQNGDFALSGMM